MNFLKGPSVRSVWRGKVRLWPKARLCFRLGLFPMKLHEQKGVPTSPREACFPVPGSFASHSSTWSQVAAQKKRSGGPPPEATRASAPPTPPRRSGLDCWGLSSSPGLRQASGPLSRFPGSLVRTFCFWVWGEFRASRAVGLSLSKDFLFFGKAIGRFAIPTALAEFSDGVSLRDSAEGD